MATEFEFIDTKGDSQRVKADSLNAAKELAVDIAPDSGFREIRNNAENGVVSASKLEGANRLNIPDAPAPQAANSIITGTSVPEGPKDAPKDNNQLGISSDAQSLRQTLSERQDILGELGLSDIRDSFEDLLQKGAFTQEAEEDAGISNKTTSLNEIQSQLRETDLKFRRNIEEIQDAPGLTRGQKNARISEVGRKQARQLADLSVIQATRRDDLATAQALVDRKVELEFEPIEQRLQFQQFLFQENKELFTLAEQRQFDKKVREEQVQIDKDKFKFQQLEELKAGFVFNAAQAGASNSFLQSIQGAESADQLFAIPGIQSYSLSQEEKMRNNLLGIQISNANQQAEAARAAQESGLLSEEQLDLSDDLRGEYNNLAEVKSAKDLEANATSLLIALEQEDGVSDISAINSFQRLVVDPGVAVREGDVALLQSAQSFTDKATLKAKGLLVGDKLTPTARAQMKQLVRGVYDARVAIVDKNTQPIKNRAAASGINEDKYYNYIGQQYATASEIEEKAKNIDPAESVLSSYDDVIEDPVETPNFFSSWLNKTNF